MTTTPPPTPEPLSTLVDLHDDGLLWLINRVVFHPRGFALGHVRGTDSWTLYGNGDEPWDFQPPAVDDESFRRAEAAMSRVRAPNPEQSG